MNIKIQLNELAIAELPLELFDNNEDAIFEVDVNIAADFIFNVPEMVWSTSWMPTTWRVPPRLVKRVFGKFDLPRVLYPVLTEQMDRKLDSVLSYEQLKSVMNSDLDIWFAAPAIDDPTKISFFTKPLDALKYETFTRQEPRNEYRRKHGVMTRPGRFFSKFGISSTLELERITGAFKDYEFELVSGEDIRRFYSVHNYTKVEDSTLHASCMKYDQCQPFFDLYVDELEMLIARDSDNKIFGRAILWRNVEVTGVGFEGTITFLDRIYGVPAFVESAKIYAREQGWYHKQHQNYCSHHEVVTPDGKNIELDMAYPAKRRYNSYPYMDTFNYVSDSDVMNNYEDGKNLEGTEGNSENYCQDCGNPIAYDEEIYLDDGSMICQECASNNYTRCEDCWELFPNSDVVIVDDQAYCENCVTNHATVCDECCEWIPNDDAREHDGYYYCDSCYDQITVECAECGEEFNIHDIDTETNICKSCQEVIDAKEMMKEEKSNDQRSA